MAGLFGGLFDFNHDGKLDAFERATEISFIADIMEEDGGEINQDREDFATVGLDMDELELMDDDDRSEALEEAGLDPDDYYF